MNSFEDLNSYLRDVRGCSSLLSVERERELLRILAEETNEKKKQLARDELITSNLSLVIWIATEINRTRYLYSITIKDLISEGNVALARAVDGYKYSSSGGVKFSSYATVVIRNHIFKKMDEDYTIKIPSTDYYKYDIEFRRMIDKYGDDLTDEIVLAETSIPESSLSTVKRRTSIRVVSIFQPIYNDDSNSFLIDIIQDKEARTACDISSEYSVRDYIRKYFSCLNIVEKYVVERIYLSSDKVTLEQIASELKCTKARIGQIDLVSLKKLRIAIQKDWCKIHNKQLLEKKGTRNMAAYRSSNRHNNEQLHDYEVTPEDNRKILRYFLQGAE